MFVRHSIKTLGNSIYMFYCRHYWWDRHSHRNDRLGAIVWFFYTAAIMTAVQPFPLNHSHRHVVDGRIRWQWMNIFHTVELSDEDVAKISRYLPLSFLYWNCDLTRIYQFELALMDACWICTWKLNTNFVDMNFEFRSFLWMLIRALLSESRWRFRRHREKSQFPSTARRVCGCSEFCSMWTIFLWPTGGGAICVTCSDRPIYGRFVFISRQTINSLLTGCEVMASASKINCIDLIVVSRWIVNTRSHPLLFRDIQKQYIEITGITPDVNAPTFLRFLWLTLGQSYVCSSASEVIPTD